MISKELLIDTCRPLDEDNYTQMDCNHCTRTMTSVGSEALQTVFVLHSDSIPSRASDGARKRRERP